MSNGVTEQLIQDHSRLTESFTEVRVSVGRMIEKQSHLEEKVDKIGENLSNLKISVDTRIGSVEQAARETEERVKAVESRTGRLGNALEFVRKFWPILLFLGIGVGGVIDYFYKLPPPT